MASITASATTLPKHAYSKADICLVGDRWLADAPRERELFRRFVDSSRIEQRYFGIPLEEILGLGGSGERAARFEQAARPLLTQTIATLLQIGKKAPEKVDHLLFTSCSSPSIPAIDVGAIDDLGLRQSINRLPIYQHGCAGGIIALAMASRLVKEGEIAIVSSAEMCSLVYQQRDLTGGNLVGSAIFGDGAAAVLIEANGAGTEIVAAQSYLIPNSRDLMGYTIEDDGAHLRLDRALPQALAHHAPNFLRQFLAQHSLKPEEIKWWLFHPGGVKILTVLEETLGIERERARWSWEALEQYGNMSSASILFVLDLFRQSSVARSGDLICMVGVGPGLTIESILLRES